MRPFKHQLRKIIMRLFSFVFNSPRPVVLMYHSVGPLEHQLSITPLQFEEQIKYLMENDYHFLKPSDLKKLSNISNKSVLITFDDGLEDVFLNAVPVLERYKVPAVFFIVTGLIGKKYIRPEFRCMDWNQIQRLNTNPEFEIGCHTVSHPRLDSLTPSEQQNEIADCKKTLEDNLQRKVVSFAAPFGNYNADTLRIIHESRIDFAFTVEQDDIHSVSNVLEIPRIAVDGFNSAFFPDILKNGYSLYRHMYYFFFPSRKPRCK